MTEQSQSVLYCSFCGKSAQEVKTIIASIVAKPTVIICNECVDMCAEILKNVLKIQSVHTVLNDDKRILEEDERILTEVSQIFTPTPYKGTFMQTLEVAAGFAKMYTKHRKQPWPPKKS